MVLDGFVMNVGGFGWFPFVSASFRMLHVSVFTNFETIPSIVKIELNEA